MKGRLGRQGVGFEACRKGKVGVEAIAGRGKGGGGGEKKPMSPVPESGCLSYQTAQGPAVRLSEASWYPTGICSGGAAGAL